MPELPLDETQWGYVASSVLPTSSYNNTFIDPKEVTRRNLIALKALKEGRLDEHLFEGFERRAGIVHDEDVGSEFEVFDEDGEAIAKSDYKLTDPNCMKENDEEGDTYDLDSQTKNIDRCTEVGQNGVNEDYTCEDARTVSGVGSHTDTKSFMTHKSKKSKISIFSNCSKTARSVAKYQSS